MTPSRFCVSRALAGIVIRTAMPLAAALAIAAIAVGAEPVVYLDSTTSFAVTIKNRQSQSIWKREVMRQALLLAARAEMHVPSRDVGLGEDIPFADEQCLELASPVARPNRIQLLQGSEGKRKPIWMLEFTDESEWPHHRAWIERMEILSRGGFVEALEKAKFTRLPAPQPNALDSPLDPELMQLIDGDMSFVNLFLAIRNSHEAIAKNGESPARLAGLIRAYANLGITTEYLWHPMSYVFKARALLYAQRWAARDSKSKAALWHRAYAFALVGMHGEALTELRAAAKLPDDNTKSDPPAWLPLIEAYCRYDYEKLKRMQVEEQFKPLATLLYFLAHEQEGSRNLTVTVGLEMLREMPSVYRMVDTLCQFTGPGAGHLTTQIGQMHMATTLLPRLVEVGALPPHVKAALEKAGGEGAIFKQPPSQEAVFAEINHRARVIHALHSAPPVPAGEPPAKPDGAEPSWSVLGNIIEETSFTQVFRRAFFVRSQIGLPVDDYLDTYEPLVKNHRYALFLAQFRAISDRREMDVAMQAFDLNDNTFAQAPLWMRWPDALRRKASISADTHDELLPNEEGLCVRSTGYTVRGGPGQLLAVSPHCPYAIAASLRMNREEEPELEKSWNETAKWSPYVAQAFGEVWTRRGDLGKAEEYLQLAARLDPSFENYQRLAIHYKTKGDDEKWLKALDDYLKTPSLGLQHAQVQCEIAKYYSERREWDKALPYADEAAQTGAQWAISWAIAMNEANQNWDVAEEHFIANIERYRESPAPWYFFCQRNGCGQLDLARQTAFPGGVESYGKDETIPAAVRGLALFLEGKTTAALDVYEKENKAAPATWVAMQAAMTADLMGDKAKRDELLKLAVEQQVPPTNKNDLRPKREELIELSRKIIADLASGGKCAFKFEELHALRDRAPPRDQCSFNFFLACYLDRRGKSDQAVEYWKQCMGASDLIMSSRTLAGFELHKRGVKPRDWKQLLFTKVQGAK